MEPRARSIVLASALALAGCSGAPVTLTQAMDSCDRGAQHAEVHGRGTVERVLGIRESRTGEHEGFIVRMNERSIKVETNTGITGPIPLHRGDTIALQGQYECSDGVIHWTHHDPRGRHMSGYIEIHGYRYQ